jgi:hypothetical protein
LYTVHAVSKENRLLFFPEIVVHLFNRRKFFLFFLVQIFCKKLMHRWKDNIKVGGDPFSQYIEQGAGELLLDSKANVKIPWKTSSFFFTIDSAWCSSLCALFSDATGGLDSVASGVRTSYCFKVNQRDVGEGVEVAGMAVRWTNKRDPKGIR